MNPAARIRYGTGQPARRARRNPFPPGTQGTVSTLRLAGPDELGDAGHGPPAVTPHVQEIVHGPFTSADLRGIRLRVAELAERWHLPEPVSSALELVVTELVVNVVMHAGGAGRFRVAKYPGWLFCQVTDFGDGLARPYTAGWQPPSAEQPSGRGLWIARCFSERLTIDSSPLGTTVTAKLRLDGPPGVTPTS
ncbi:ATP-binding protein [Catellatospora sp. NPDC049609]|uniref:ATP-binding protein n=1 Tax=Catellatospora sp. NPDC049609 TaxID=3155505 RepID=UPI003442F077